MTRTSFGFHAVLNARGHIGPMGYVIGICEETWLSMKLFVLKCSAVRRVSLVLYIFLHLVDQRHVIGIWYPKSRVLD